MIGQKASAALSSGTLATGLGTYFQLVPEILGALASLAGLILSVVVIHDRIKKGFLERRKLRAQIDIIEHKAEEHPARKRGTD